MNYTDEQLKRALAKMLPDAIYFREDEGLFWKARMIPSMSDGIKVCATELLHICWLAEETLDTCDMVGLHQVLKESSLRGHNLYHATWQQRTIDLAKVKGIEI